MKASSWALRTLVALCLPALAWAEGAAGPAPGTAVGKLTFEGKSVTLTHAVAFNAGAYIFVLVTDQALPPDQVKSEFQIGMYAFQHHVTGVQILLESTHKLKDVTYLGGPKKACPGCVELTLGADLPGGGLTGVVKSTAKSAAEKVAFEATFAAPFAKASAGK